MVDLLHCPTFNNTRLPLQPTWAIFAPPKRHASSNKAMSRVILKPKQTSASGATKANPLELYDREILLSMNKTKPQNVSSVEWELRCKLAMAYRVADYYDWKQLIFNHITVKIPGSEIEENGPYFLINPLGMRFDEMTASCLLKVTVDGAVVDYGSNSGTLFRQGYVIHSAIHEVRHDVMCCWHSHHEDTAAICTTKVGLLPISQEAVAIYPTISYHPFEGTANDMSERPRLQNSLGPSKMLLMLENHGPCALGTSIESAFALMYNCTRACTYQQKAMAAVGGDLSKLHIPTDEMVQQMIARSSKEELKSISNQSKDYDDGAGAGASNELMFRAISRLIEKRDGPENIYS